MRRTRMQNQTSQLMLHRDVSAIPPRIKHHSNPQEVSDFNMHFIRSVVLVWFPLWPKPGLFVGMLSTFETVEDTPNIGACSDHVLLCFEVPRSTEKRFRCWAQTLSLLPHEFRCEYTLSQCCKITALFLSDICLVCVISGLFKGTVPFGKLPSHYMLSSRMLQLIFNVVQFNNIFCRQFVCVWCESEHYSVQGITVIWWKWIFTRSPAWKILSWVAHWRQFSNFSHNEVRS